MNYTPDEQEFVDRIKAEAKSNIKSFKQSITIQMLNMAAANSTGPTAKQYKPINDYLNKVIKPRNNDNYPNEKELTVEDYNKIHPLSKGLNLYKLGIDDDYKKLQTWEKKYGAGGTADKKIEELITVLRDNKNQKDKKSRDAAAKKIAELKTSLGTAATTGKLLSAYGTDSEVVAEIEQETATEDHALDNPIKPQFAEFTFDRIRQNYISLRKGTKDQHLLSMYGAHIMNTTAMTRTSAAAAKGRVFSIKSGLDTNRLTNIFSFKMEYVKDKDYEGFLINPLVTLNNAQLAALTPRVEFFVYNREKKTKKPIPIQNRGLSTQKRTGITALNNFQSVLGLQDLTIRLAGDTPETAKRDIDSTITFYGSNLSVFSSKRGRELYLPLIQPEGLGSEDGSPKDLMMTVGWNMPSSETIKSLNYTPLQVKSLKRQLKTFVMSYYKHSFNFNEDGSFMLQCDYVSRTSEVFQDIDVMSDGDSHVRSYYDGLISQMPKETQPTLNRNIQRVVNEYINRVHPTASDDTKKKIRTFFKKIPKKEHNQVTTHISVHTDYFQQKKTKKINAVLNHLTDNSKMYRFAIEGKAYREKLFDTAFSRVMRPHFYKLNFTDDQMLPPKMCTTGGSQKVVDFRRVCRFRMQVSKTLDEEFLKPEEKRIKVQRMLVTKDSEGNELPGLSIMEELDLDDIVNVRLPDTDKSYIEISPTKKTAESDNPIKKIKSKVDSIAKGDDKTKKGRKAVLDEETKTYDKKVKVLQDKLERAKKGEYSEGWLDDSISVATAKAQKELDAELARHATVLADLDSEHAVLFFTMGDIISSFLKVSESVKVLERDKVSVMLGNIRINRDFYNLYKIPIALETYQKIMKDFEQSTARRFTLQKLITSLLREVQRYYNQGDYVLDSGKHTSAYSMKVGQFRTTPEKIKKLRRASSVDKLYAEGYGQSGGDETVYYYTMSQASTELNIQDALRLTKWEVGKDKSIIRKISFKQVENQSMKAKQDDNIEKGFRSENGLIMIPQFYNVDITSFGLIDFYPGLSFFVKPSLIGVADISDSPVFKEVGLTGLYNVINVEHKIDSSGFSTSFKCYNESTVDWTEAIEAIKPKGKEEKKRLLERQATAKKERNLARIMRKVERGKLLTETEMEAVNND